MHTYFTVCARRRRAIPYHEVSALDRTNVDGVISPAFIAEHGVVVLSSPESLIRYCVSRRCWWSSRAVGTFCSPIVKKLQQETKRHAD